MRFSQFIVIPIIVAALAFTIQILDQLISGLMPITDNRGFGWIAFISWPLYFLAGCNILGGVKIFNGFVVGILASIAIMELGSLFTLFSSFFAFPAAIFVLVAICLCLERFPPFDLVPAIFVGAGIYFAMMTYVPGATYVSSTVTEMIYCVIGLLYGWITIFLRGKYENSLGIQANVIE